RPPTINAGEFLHQPAVQSGTNDPVRQRRKLRTDAVEPFDPAEEPVAQRQTIDSMIMIEKLVLEFRHIDVGRTLGLAGFTFQTKIHHVIEPFARELTLRGSPG